MQADLILIDERKGTSAAIAKGFEVTGTLGILRLAAQRGLIDLAGTIKCWTICSTNSPAARNRRGLPRQRQTGLYASN